MEHGRLFPPPNSAIPKPQTSPKPGTVNRPDFRKREIKEKQMMDRMNESRKMANSDSDADQHQWVVCCGRFRIPVSCSRRRGLGHVEAPGVWVHEAGWFNLITLTHTPLSSSFLGLPYRILYINHKKDLHRDLYVNPKQKNLSRRWQSIVLWMVVQFSYVQCDIY